MQTLRQPQLLTRGAPGAKLAPSRPSPSSRTVSAPSAWWRSLTLENPTTVRGADSAAATVTVVEEPPVVAEPALEPVAAPSLEDVEAQFDLWNRRLQEGNPSAVADLYLTPSAVLLATLSNEPRTTHEAITDYFTSFLARKPVGTIVQKHVRIMEDPTGTTAVNSGIYVFNFKADGTSATARYTFMYRLVDGEWKIIFHHSSLMPETLEDQIKNTFAKWNAALQTGDPEKVADLYAHDAVLLPTVSNVVRTNRAAIVDYFSTFLKRKPAGTVDVGYVLDLGVNLAAYAGIYTFSFGDGSTAQARFSFKYRKGEDGQWLILDHHSSVLPEAKPFVAA